MRDHDSRRLGLSGLDSVSSTVQRPIVMDYTVSPPPPPPDNEGMR